MLSIARSPSRYLFDYYWFFEAFFIVSLFDGRYTRAWKFELSPRSIDLESQSSTESDGSGDRVVIHGVKIKVSPPAYIAASAA